MSDFDTYLQTRKAASDAFLAGDTGPLSDVSVTSGSASILGPAGTVVTGVAEVAAANAAGASRFTGGETNTFETVDSGVDGDLAYWVGVQRSVVRVEGQDVPVPFDLRLTELFRREDGAWKLFHRHADPLAE